MTDRPFERILYADDEPDIRKIARLALEKLGGFTLKLCASGEEALAAAPEFAPDLVILDVMMPGMDGLETLQRLRDLGAFETTPVVFMTAKAQSGETQRFRAAGAAAVISKPFQPMKLAEDLRALWQTLQP